MTKKQQKTKRPRTVLSFQGCGLVDLAGKLGVSKQHLSAVLHGERASKRLLSAVWRERPELVTPAALKASGLTKATIGKAVAK